MPSKIELNDVLFRAALLVVGEKYTPKLALESLKTEGYEIPELNLFMRFLRENNLSKPLRKNVVVAQNKPREIKKKLMDKGLTVCVKAIFFCKFLTLEFCGDFQCRVLTA